MLNQASQFGLTLTSSQLAQFEQYQQILLEWNQYMNLTRITDPTEIAVKHFLDSLSIYIALQKLPRTFALIDVGTGAGFPGIPLKIALPSIRLSLVESTGKKAAFLEEVIEHLKLSHTKVIHARAEEVGQEISHRQQYHIAVARAVGRLPVLVEYLLPLVKVGGFAIAQKGQHPTEELAEAQWGIRKLGGYPARTTPITVPGLEAERQLIIIKKKISTPKIYPRRPGLPKKEPLVPKK